MKNALKYVRDNTYCGVDADWHLKEGYDPQVVLDAIAQKPKRLSDESLKQLEDLVEIWEDDGAGGDEGCEKAAVSLSLLLEWYKEEHV